MIAIIGSIRVEEEASPTDCLWQVPKVAEQWALDHAYDRGKWMTGAIAGATEIVIDYMTNDKQITTQSAHKFRWFIAKMESILLPDRAQTCLEAGVGLYLLYMRGEEPIARRPLWTYHRQAIGEASSATPIDHMMAVVTRLGQGQQSLTSQMTVLSLVKPSSRFTCLSWTHG